MIASEDIVQSADSLGSWTRVQEAGEALLAARRSQRGQSTLGDAHDAALLEALAAVPEDDAPHVAERAERLAETLGREVYVKRTYEDSFAGAFVILSTSLLESGLGVLRVEDVFHRSAEVAFRPLDAAARVPAALLRSHVTGLMRGFFSEAFNCHVRVRCDEAHRYRVDLLQGRDVNRGSA